LKSLHFNNEAAVFRGKKSGEGGEDW